VVTAGLLSHGWPAWAVIPSPTGVFHGCYQPKKGTLRVVDEGVTCRRKERAIQWNEQGPAGPPGTPDTTNFYDKTESDGRFLPRTGVVLAARVDGGGTLLGGRGAVSATWTTVIYRVTFDRDVSQCAYSVTPQPPAGWDYMTKLYMLAQADSGAPSQVVVFASNGAGSNVVVPFHLVVVCP
jgi:hypothetical protein